MELDILETLSGLERQCSAGFAIALHIRYNAPKFLFQTYSRAWMDIYSKEGLVLKDPTVIWGFSNSGTIRWRDLAGLDEAGVLERARAYGLAHGFTVSTDEAGGRSIASFARTDTDFTDAEMAVMAETLRDLHAYTAGVTMIPEQEQEQLRRMSIAFTHS